VPRLLRLSGREARAILERHGFVLVRQKGSHMIMQHRRPEGGTTTVPVPDHRELRTGTLLGIIEQSGLPRTLFEAPS
jgi:predicted RNA binding protein YcfA (HicA-like mRNA interferase family)